MEIVARDGIPLNNWRRSFILDPSLRPCRDTVLEFDYVRGLLGNEWFSPNYVVGDDAALQSNRELMRGFVAQAGLVPDAGDGRRTDFQKHLWNGTLLLRDVLSQLITQYRVHDPIDSQRLMGALLQLGWALDANPDEPCAVYQMSGGLARARGVTEEGKISTNLFQGAAPPTGPNQGSIYPGDRETHVDGVVSVQIHNLTLRRPGADDVVNVPVLAVRIPQRLTRPWLLQRQPNQQNA